MDVSALLRLKQRASRMAPSEFSFTATSQLTDPTIYLCSGSKPCSESTPCKRTTLKRVHAVQVCSRSAFAAGRLLQRVFNLAAV